MSYKKKTYENSEVCGCGQHWGIGTWSPFRRAMVYAWMESNGEVFGQSFTAQMAEYLETWREHHGEIHYSEIEELKRQSEEQHRENVGNTPALKYFSRA